MFERIGEFTPTSIVQLFLLPYIAFSEMFGGRYKTLLDCGCGNLYQQNILEDRFGKVFFVDKEDRRTDNFFKADLNFEKLPFPMGKFDVVFSFEVIEHLEKENQEKFVEELVRVSNDFVVIGSVSKDGPSYVGEDLIFKKSLDCNPFHKNEFTSFEWKKFFKRVLRNVEYFHSELNDDGLEIVRQLDGKKGFCNYVVIRKGV